MAKSYFSFALQGFFLFLACTSILGQECNYISPIKGSTVLSGSYGEPRASHFHAGNDLKQHRGIPKDTIYAVERGYISRISIRPDGYGNALYITHPCGQTSVYGHLYEFNPRIKNFISKIMIKRQIYSIDMPLNSTQLPISSGTPIGIMGNTGGSSGPHLHFEIRDTKSEKSINPALFGFKPGDSKRPVIKGIVVYTMTPDGQELKKKYYPAKYISGDQYRLITSDISIGALIVGVGVHAYDTMNGASNHNGIYALKLKVDGNTQFNYKMDSLSFKTSQYINSHMDYEALTDKRYIIKCFRNIANPLPFYRQNEEGGVMSLFEFRPRNLSISVYDIERNQANIEFRIIRDTILNPLPIQDKELSTRLNVTDSLLIKGIHSTILIPSGALMSPTILTLPQDNPEYIDLRQSQAIPLFKYIRISDIISNQLYPKEKYIFKKEGKNGRVQSYRAQWESDTSMYTYVKEFDKYFIGIDTVPPSIDIISLPANGRRRGTLVIKDDLIPAYSKGSIKFKVLINGHWFLCQHDTKTNKIWWDMAGESLNKTHTLKVIVTDASKNQSSIERTFVY